MLLFRSGRSKIKPTVPLCRSHCEKLATSYFPVCSLKTLPVFLSLPLLARIYTGVVQAMRANCECRLLRGGWSCAEVLQPNQWKVDREKGLLGVASCRMARIARTRGIERDATGRHMHPPTRRPEGKVVGLYSGSDRSDARVVWIHTC